MGSDVPWYQLVAFGPQAFRGYARLRFLPDPTAPGQEPTGFLGPDAPSENDLLGLALAVLGEHTHTPMTCTSACGTAGVRHPRCEACQW